MLFLAFNLVGYFFLIISTFCKSDLVSEGIAGWFGVYRDMLTTVDQTAPLASNKVQTPVLAMGGANSLGATVAEQMRQVAQNVTESVIENCGHFIPEEKPEELVRRFLDFSSSV